MLLKTLAFRQRPTLLVEADWFCVLILIARHSGQIATIIGSINGNNGSPRPDNLRLLGGVDLFVDGLGNGFGEPGEAEQGFKGGGLDGGYATEFFGEALLAGVA